jgi:hypothetical protein
MGAFEAWFLNPPPAGPVPSQALAAISSIAVVIWTGGFIVRGWMQSTAVALMAGMNYLQFAFFASILVLLANGLTLRCIAIAFLFYYGFFFLRYSSRLREREPDVELFLPYLDQVRVKGSRFWLALQYVQLIPIGITILWPIPVILAWCCAIMTFLGYQIILAFVYSDILSQPKRRLP